MFVKYNLTNTQNWRDRAKHLQAIRNEYEANCQIMTPYETQLASRYYAEQKQQHEDYIIAGSIAEWNIGVNDLKNALADVEKAKVNEINRWQSPRLRDEMQVFQMRIEQVADASRGDNAQARKQLESIYQEAKASGDTYKQRAVAETMKAALSKFRGDVMDPDFLAINRIGKQAEQDLIELRNSPELEQTRTKTAEAVKTINTLKNRLFEAADSLGYVNPNGTLRSTPFIKALERVQQTPDGEFEIS
ncbi:MAG: hypothetical protein LLG42_16475 [Chloroflexi bacterium]|nr:hypothetical protein [Chloroflexota bacterium]